MQIEVESNEKKRARVNEEYLEPTQEQRAVEILLANVTLVVVVFSPTIVASG